VLETLKSKHPDVTSPEVSTLHPYSEIPNFNDINVTEDVVESVACRLRGYTGPSSTDSSVETLKLKYPDVMTPEASTLHPYSEVPNFNDSNVTEDVVECGTYSISLQYWLLQYGKSSCQLHVMVADFID
jgi:hypothetical protein